MNYDANILNNAYLEYFKSKNFHLHLISKMENRTYFKPFRAMYAN